MKDSDQARQDARVRPLLQSVTNDLVNRAIDAQIKLRQTNVGESAYFTLDNILGGSEEFYIQVVVRHHAGD